MKHEACAAMILAAAMMPDVPSLSEGLCSRMATAMLKYDGEMKQIISVGVRQNGDFIIGYVDNFEHELTFVFDLINLQQ